jgi:hypothetical protein
VTRLLVAASAVSLTVGWPGYTWDQLAEVLLYPEDFDRDYNFGGSDASGRAHPWGIVILSVPALNRSFDEVSDGCHVGFHEFAHSRRPDSMEFRRISATIRFDAGWRSFKTKRTGCGGVIPYLTRMLCRAGLSSLRLQSKLFFRRLLRSPIGTARHTSFFRDTSARIRLPGVIR